MAAARVDPTATVAEGASLGADTTVWGLALVREGAVVGAHCTIGRGAYVDAGVRLGDRCKLQDHVLVYSPAVLGDGVFLGPGVVLANDPYPRAVTPEGRLQGAADWRPLGVTVGEGAAIGARAVVLAGVRIGSWALVGAGAVVSRDVPDFALVVGVPARRTGWVGQAGVPLTPDGENAWRCPRTGRAYLEENGALREQM